jgi:hypothetical protein
MSIRDLIDIDNIEPVKFHPYTSIVTDRLISVEYDKNDYYINRLEKDLIELFNEWGITAHIDNKIVFECVIHNTKIYIYRIQRLGILNWILYDERKIISCDVKQFVRVIKSWDLPHVKVVVVKRNVNL